MQEALESVVLMLAPMTPHVCHVLWRELGHADDVIDARWPTCDPDALTRETVDIVVQVNGKLRGRVSVAADASRDAIERAALADANVQKYVENQPVKKVVIVPGKLVNVVV
jgi:leucyl-tRNA synthetase